MIATLVVSPVGSAIKVMLPMESVLAGAKEDQFDRPPYDLEVKYFRRQMIVLQSNFFFWNQYGNI